MFKWSQPFTFVPLAYLKPLELYDSLHNAAAQVELSVAFIIALSQKKRTGMSRADAFVKSSRQKSDQITAWRKFIGFCLSYLVHFLAFENCTPYACSNHELMYIRFFVYMISWITGDFLFVEMQTTSC